eukprot:Opistho-2@20435
MSESVDIHLSCRLVIAAPVRSHIAVSFEDNETVDLLRERAIAWLHEAHPSVSLPPPLQPRLFHAGAELSDPTVLLSHAGVTSGSCVYVVVPQLRPSVRAVSISPSSCLESGGAHVIIRGESFSHSCVCRFGSTLALTLFVSETEITATAPPHGPGPVSVEVSPDGHTFSIGGPTFTYVALRDASGTCPIALSADCGAQLSLVEMDRAAAVLYRHDRGNL